jgi:hypothetical protein
MHLVGLVSLFFVSVSLVEQAFSRSSIPAKIISGGEVSITEVKARFDGQTITVIEYFPIRVSVTLSEL